MRKIIYICIIILGISTLNVIHLRSRYMEDTKHSKVLEEVIIEDSSQSETLRRTFNNYPEYLSYLDSMLHVSKDKYEYCYSLASAYLTLGEFEQAAQHFNHAVQLRPYMAGQIAYRQLREFGDYRNAIRNLNIFIKSVGDKNAFIEGVNAFYYLGIAKREIKDWKGAEHAFAIYAKIAPRIYYQYYLDKGLLYLKQKQFDKAHHEFAQALLKQPNLPEAFYHQGITYHQEGKTKLAVESLQKAYKYRKRLRRWRTGEFIGQIHPEQIADTLAAIEKELSLQDESSASVAPGISG